MNLSNKLGRIGTGALLALFAVAMMGTTGCTVYTNGMTLPNPHYQGNIPQFFPKGTEFPFPNEAANIQEAERSVQHGH